MRFALSVFICLGICANTALSYMSSRRRSGYSRFSYPSSSWGSSTRSIPNLFSRQFGFTRLSYPSSGWGPSSTGSSGRSILSSLGSSGYKSAIAALSNGLGLSSRKNANSYAQGNNRLLRPETRQPFGIQEQYMHDVRNDFNCQTDTGLSFTDFINLYWSPVTFARYYERKLDSSGLSSHSSRQKRWSSARSILPAELKPVHSGVVLTTTFNGETNWLIHRTDDKTCPTRIEDARSMRNNGWKKVRCGAVPRGKYTLKDYYKSAMPDEPYDWMYANCHHATLNMWELTSHDVFCKSRENIPF